MQRTTDNALLAMNEKVTNHNVCLWCDAQRAENVAKIDSFQENYLLVKD